MSKVFIGKEYAYHVKLLQLIRCAQEDGIILTIGHQARKPLSMGNFDSVPGVRYSREAQLTKLWMLNIEGPDDIVAAPSFLEAVKVRDEFNAYWREVKARHSDPDSFPVLHAVIQEWDDSPELHAISANFHWGDYLCYDVALVAMIEAKRA